jgi:hypothetical protein
MHKARSFSIIGAGLGLMLATSAALADDSDTQLWNSTNFDYKIDNKWSTNVELQERWYDDVSYLAYFIVRPSVTYQWNDWLSFTGGYGFFRNYAEGGGYSDENRIWEQVNIRLFGGIGKPTLDWRTRLEQRMFETGGGTRWRLREQLRLMFPIVDRVQGVAWSEGFWQLNNTENSDAGFQTWRNFVGLDLEINERITFEAGYMNNLNIKSSGNTDDHVPWLITTFKF